MSEQNIKGWKMEKINVNLNDVEYDKVIEGKSATVTVKNEKLYQEQAAENGIEKKTIEKMVKFDETYLNAAVEAAVKEAEDVLKENKDVKEVDIYVPFGIRKSDKVHTYVVREKTFPIPGTDKKVTKSVIKPMVISHRYNISKSKRKELEDKLTKAIIGQ